MTAEAW